MFNFLRKTVWFKLIFFPDCTGPCYYSVLACTQALFYFSLRSFSKHRRARESEREKEKLAWLLFFITPRKIERSVNRLLRLIYF